MPKYFIYKPKNKQWLQVSEEVYEKWTGKKTKG